jgi:hypothetical protein
MPFSFQVSRVARRACMRAEGHADLGASLAAFHRLAHDPRLGEGFHVLIDMRGSSWNLSTDDAMDLATAAAQIPHRSGKVALLVTTAALGAARVFCELANIHGLDVVPFDRTEEAHRWLAIGRRTH